MKTIKKFKYRSKLSKLYYQNYIYRNKYLDGNTIVIFGNGVDLYNGLRTSFSDFYSSPEYKKIGESNIYHDKKEWNDLEGTLYLKGVEDIGDDGYYFLYKNFNEVKKQLVKYLSVQEDKVRKNNKPEPIRYLLASLNNVDGAINFNYTNTIEKIYNFTKLPINYIHGSLKEYKNDHIDIVLGISKDIASTNVVKNDTKF